MPHILHSKLFFQPDLDLYPTISPPLESSPASKTKVASRSPRSIDLDEILRSHATVHFVSQSKLNFALCGLTNKLDIINS